MAQNRILLSFSKKNTDVFEILEEKKKENIIISDYICKCIRYYEYYGSENNDKESIEDTVKRVIADMFVNGAVPITTVSTATEENDETEEKPKGYAALEDINNDDAIFMNIDDD